VRLTPMIMIRQFLLSPTSGRVMRHQQVSHVLPLQKARQSARCSNSKRLALAALFNLLLFGCPALAWSAELVEETGYFRVTIEGRTVRLQGMTVKRPDATDKLPIALITHGKPPNQASMLDLRPEHLVGPARDLARRGWLAVVVLRRGFGQSDGPMPRPATCASTSFNERFSADADDLQATLELIAQRPDADATRAIAIGVSAGGAAVSALAARNPKNLMGVINVSGGVRFESCPKDDALVAAFREFGAQSRVPGLWLYAKNDTLFGPALVDRMHHAFLDGGGDVKLVMYDAFGTEGHWLFGNGRHQWLMEMDSFLRFHRLPTWQPRDADALILKLKSKNRDFVERYLAAPSERALARSTTTAYLHMSWGFRTIELARAQALEGCQKQKPAEQCTLVMENDRWVGEEAADRSTQTAPLIGQHDGP
jgi:dienelactone hydrolase